MLSSTLLIIALSKLLLIFLSLSTFVAPALSLLPKLPVIPKLLSSYLFLSTLIALAILLLSKSPAAPKLLLTYLSSSASAILALSLILAYLSLFEFTTLTPVSKLVFLPSF